jgi:hypothetical protein
VVTNANPYDAINPNLTATNTFSVVVKEVNEPPELPVVPPQIVDELASLTVTNTASEPNIHSTISGYGLVNPPPGMTIDSDGVIRWTPAQTQSPSTNTITTVATNTNPYDLINPHLTATNTFAVVVRELNQAPLLPVVPPQSVNELTLLTVTNTASEPNIHSSTIGYALLNPPAGMTIDSNGTIRWTPGVTQSPSTNVITTVVTNSNPYDSVNPRLTATNSFTIVVNEVNSPPTLSPIADQSVHYGSFLTVQVSASDTNLPKATLTFSLDSAPTNMTIDASTGLISWTPSVTQVGTNTVTVRVTDYDPYAINDQHLSSTTTFHVLVTGEAASLAIQPLAGGFMQVTITADVGVVYNIQFSTNLANWDTLLHFTLPSSPYPYVDTGSASAPRRFYRLQLSQ